MNDEKEEIKGLISDAVVSYMKDENNFYENFLKDISKELGISFEALKRRFDLKMKTSVINFVDKTVNEEAEVVWHEYKKDKKIQNLGRKRKMEKETDLNIKVSITGMLDIAISDLQEIKSDIESGRDQDIPRLLKRSKGILNSLKLEDDESDENHRKSYRLE